MNNKVEAYFNGKKLGDMMVVNQYWFMDSIKIGKWIELHDGEYDSNLKYEYYFNGKIMNIREEYATILGENYDEDMLRPRHNVKLYDDEEWNISYRFFTIDPINLSLTIHEHTNLVKYVKTDNYLMKIKLIEKSVKCGQHWFDVTSMEQTIEHEYAYRIIIHSVPGE